MVAAQAFLNSFPFLCCLFVVFFGRLFSHVLRTFLVALVIACPLLGYILLQGRSYSTSLLSDEEGSLNITATYVVAIVWAAWTSICGVYACIKHAAMGKRIESLGIGFLIVSVLSSFYMGYVHKDVIKERPGVVSYMQWITALAIALAAVAIHTIRKIPGMVDVMESLIHALTGSFVALQFYASMGFESSEGLEWRRIVTQEFGCQTTGCLITISFFAVLAAVGTLAQVILFKSGNKDTPYSRLADAAADMLIALKNINSVLYSYSMEAENETDLSTLHKLRLSLSEDVYKVLGGLSDVLLLTFAVGLDAACVEMIYMDAYITFGEDALAYGVWLIVFAVVATGLALFTIKIRLDTAPVLSDSWKKQRRILLLMVCVVWPFMVFSALFSMTVGGEEIAAVDVPIINQKFGFHLIPIGCDSLNDPPAIVDETDTDAWKLENAEAIMFENASWWDGHQCHDGLLNGDEENVDCGGSCNNKCSACQCHWSRVGTQQVELGTGFPNANLVPRYDGFQGNATAYGDNSYCWSGARDDSGLAVRYCYTVGGTNCTTADRPDIVDNTAEGFEWLDPRDTVRPCTRPEIGEVDGGVLLPSLEQECPPPPPPAHPPRRLWYCSAIKLRETARCYDCDIEDVGWDTPVCGFETKVTCNDVKHLKNELPTIVTLVWGVTITSIISALSGSGSLGGTYLMINKFTTYLTGLNFLQGIFIAASARVLSASTGDALAEMADANNVDDLQSRLGGLSLWNLLIAMGVFMSFHSLLGLVVMSPVISESSAVGGCLLRAYLFMVITSLGLSACLFAVAVYFAFNIDDIADEYWDDLIKPNLQVTNSSAIAMYDFSDVQKHEFVEFSRGSFRCLILIGCWISALLSATVACTYYVVSNRNSDEAQFAKQRKATSNPMFIDDMNSPLTAAVGVATGAAGVATGAAVAVTSGAVGVATGAVGSVAGTVVGSDEDSD